MMMKNRKIKFEKLVAAGNDFVLIDNRVYRFKATAFLRKLARAACERRYGIGADGLLVLDSSSVADVKMRIFNADGSEAEMCGNGARCFAYHVSSRLGNKKTELSLETKAGIVKARIKPGSVMINLTDPRGLKLDLPLNVGGRKIKVNFINTGVPHTVIFVEGLDKIDVQSLGRQIRYHRDFAPAGTNVDFVEVLGKDYIKVRTYERGVEGETLACGTGSSASALIAGLKFFGGASSIKVLTAGGEVLKVHFSREGLKFSGVWLEGKAGLVYKGEYYV